MSSLGSMVTAIGGALGQRGNYSLVDLVKNKPIQSNLNTLIGDYGTQVSKDSTDLNSYIKDYLSKTPQATKWGGQEQSAVDRFYNGDVEAQLAGLRANQANLGNQAVAQGLAYQRGNMNRASMTGAGGDNSYLTRTGVGVGTDVNLQNELANLGQERADVGYTNEMPLKLAGERTAIGDTLSSRLLTPVQARQQDLGYDVSTLGNLSKVQDSNNMYGAQYNPSMGEYFGDAVSGFMGGASQGLGAATTWELGNKLASQPAASGGGGGGGL